MISAVLFFMVRLSYVLSFLLVFFSVLHNALFESEVCVYVLSFIRVWSIIRFCRVLLTQIKHHADSDLFVSLI